jgi:cysteine desulfurase
MIYLDHHATTPCDPRVVDAMLPYFTERFGNAASRSHMFGHQAKAGVELAREQVATLLGASPKEVIFTSGATESNNLAILGACGASDKRHVVTTAIEHKAVLDPVAHLGERGFSVTIVPVDGSGVVEAAAVFAALRADTALVSVMAANNEVGTLQPVEAIGVACRERGVPFHVDAAQIVGKLPFRADVADLVSVSAHKLYGPKGVGALWIRRRPRVLITPLFFGGGHERGLRSGTLPVPLIVGFGAACVLAGEDLAAGVPARIAVLRDRLWSGLSAVGGAELNGDRARRLPNNLNVSFDGVDAEAIMLACREIAVSSGSACTSASLEPSHVLKAIGLSSVRAHGSIRFGLGRTTTVDEIERTITAYATAIPTLRAMAP